MLEALTRARRFVWPGAFSSEYARISSKRVLLNGKLSRLFKYKCWICSTWNLVGISSLSLLAKVYRPNLSNSDKLSSQVCKQCRQFVSQLSTRICSSPGRRRMWFWVVWKMWWLRASDISPRDRYLRALKLNDREREKPFESPESSWSCYKRENLEIGHIST